MLYCMTKRVLNAMRMRSILEKEEIIRPSMAGARGTLANQLVMSLPGVPYSYGVTLAGFCCGV